MTRKLLLIHFVIRLLVRSDLFTLVDGCREDQFECNNTQCISSKLKCNSHFDCPDYSDELNCTVTATCPEGLYSCNGGCIKAVICDGTEDCADGTDERNCAKTPSSTTFAPAGSHDLGIIIGGIICGVAALVAILHSNQEKKAKDVNCFNFLLCTEM